LSNFGSTERCYNICQCDGGSLQYDTLSPSLSIKERTILEMNGVSEYGKLHMLPVSFCNLGLYCEHNQCHFQLIQIIWCPLSWVFFYYKFWKLFSLEPNCWFIYCNAFT
jgi:hypothetical protein